MWAAFDAKLNLDDVVAAGDRVASRWTFAGTHIGEFNGLPASGREFSVHGMSIEHIADGRIAERWATADLLSLLQQINRRKGSGSRARPEVCLDGQWRDAIPRAAGRRKRRCPVRVRPASRGGVVGHGLISRAGLGAADHHFPDQPGTQQVVAGP